MFPLFFQLRRLKCNVSTCWAVPLTICSFWNQTKIKVWTLIKMCIAPVLNIMLIENGYFALHIFCSCGMRRFPPRVRPLVILPVRMANWRPQTFWAVNDFSGIETVNDVLELLDVSDGPPDLIKKSRALKVPQRCCMCHYPHDNICLCSVHLG